MKPYRHWTLHPKFRHWSLNPEAPEPCAQTTSHPRSGRAALAQLMLRRLAARLALDDRQQVLMQQLQDELRQQHEALARPPVAAPLFEMLRGERFDRDQAQQMLDARLHALQAAGPAVIAAAADFYDSLEPEQQSALRAMLHRLELRGWWSRGTYDGGLHD